MTAPKNPPISVPLAQEISEANKEMRSVPDCSLLSTAEAVLQLLERQAELARVETRKLELVTAIARARRGETEPLREWLHSNGRTFGVDRLPETASHGWKKILDRSMQRLTENPLLDPVAPHRNDPSSPKASRHPVTNEVTPKAVVHRSNLIVSIDEGIESRQSKRRWKLRGMLVSTVLHLLIFAGLAIITITVPIKGGILELEASESTEVSMDSLEMTSEVSAEAPSEQFEVATPQWQPDLANSLSAPGESIPSVLSDISGSSEASQLSQAITAVSTSSLKNMSASFYGASASGNNFCFLIDGSATLRGAPWEAARAELIRSLQALSDKQRFYVIFYNNVISRLPDRESGKAAPTAVYATRENLQHTVRWLQSLRVDTAPAGGNHTTVLQAALDLEPDAIFLLTDGEMTPSVENQVLQMLRSANRTADVIEQEVIRVPIHTIAFHSPDGVQVMKDIAEQNDGQMTFIPKPGLSDASKKRTNR